MVRVGTASIFAATATHSDASIATVTQWTSSNNAVASISSAGQLTGLTNGQAIVTATHDGIAATVPVRVVANVQGTWSGSYLITTCANYFLYVNWCTLIAGAGPAPIDFYLTQTRDTVSGVLAFGQFVGNVTGQISSNGTLSLSGTTYSDLDTFTVAAWSTNIAGNNMTGTFTVRNALYGYPGEYAINGCVLTTVTRTSPTATSRGATRSPIAIHSVADMAVALRNR